MNEFEAQNPWVVLIPLLVIAVLLLINFAQIRKLWRSHEMRRRETHAWLAAYAAAEPPQTWRTDQEWRQQTSIRFLEDLKADLVEIEKYLIAGREAALSFQNRLIAASALKRFWMEDTTPAYEMDEIARGEALCKRLDQIWVGNVYMDIEDAKDAVQELKRKARVDTDSGNKNWYEEMIVKREREVRDLNEILRRLQEREDKVSPHESQYEESQRIHELDTRAKIKNRFLPVRTQIEAFKEQRAFIQEVTDDGTLTPDQKKSLIALINEQAETVSKTALASEKPGSIYKKGEI